MALKTDKPHYSSISMVQIILQDHSGNFFSVKELVQKIKETFDTHITPVTVIKAIDQVKMSNRFFSEKSERRGHLKLPTKVFALILPVTN